MVKRSCFRRYFFKQYVKANNIWGARKTFILWQLKISRLHLKAYGTWMFKISLKKCLNSKGKFSLCFRTESLSVVYKTTFLAAESMIFHVHVQCSATFSHEKESVLWISSWFYSNAATVPLQLTVTLSDAISVMLESKRLQLVTELSLTFPCFECPSAQLALSQGEFCNMWPLAAEDPLTQNMSVLSFTYIS